MIHDKRLLYRDNIWDDAYVVRNNIHPEEWYGSILYLGMGRCYNPLKQSDKVTKTTIIEIDQRTIDYNADVINPEWNIICEDVYKFEPTEKYDFIFVDIWYEQVEGHIVDDLVERYKKYLNENGQILYLKTIKK
jgi:spermidine synthase